MILYLQIFTKNTGFEEMAKKQANNNNNKNKNNHNHNQSPSQSQQQSQQSQQNNNNNNLREQQQQNLSANNLDVTNVKSNTTTGSSSTSNNNNNYSNSSRISAKTSPSQQRPGMSPYLYPLHHRQHTKPPLGRSSSADLAHQFDQQQHNVNNNNNSGGPPQREQQQQQQMYAPSISGVRGTRSSSDLRSIAKVKLKIYAQIICYTVYYYIYCRYTLIFYQRPSVY